MTFDKSTLFAVFGTFDRTDVCGGGTDEVDGSGQHGTIQDVNILSSIIFPYNKVMLNNWRTHPC